MAVPGSIGSQMPPGEDALVRKIADLERSMRELAPSVAASFASTVAELQQQQEYQAGLVTKAANGADLDTTEIPGDGIYRFYPTSSSVTVAVATGRAVVTVGCSQIRLLVGNDTVEGAITFSAEDENGVTTFPASEAFSAKMMGSVPGFTGAGVTYSTAYLVPSKGVRTFRLGYAHWSSSTAPLGTIRILRPYIQVQVVPADD